MLSRWNVFGLSVVAALFLACGGASDSDGNGPPDHGSPGIDVGQCTPVSCDDASRECGTWTDPCGTIRECGECPDGGTCLPDGTCEVFCIPACPGRCCGDDGCGGTCPDLCVSLGQWCDPGTCACSPTCPGQTCQDPVPGLGNPCSAGASNCPDAFPNCQSFDPSGYCTRECAGDGTCGPGGCCIGMPDQKRYCVSGASSWTCDDPTATGGCPGGHGCLPVVGSTCSFCYPLGTAVLGQTCSGTNDCVAGHLCTRAQGEANPTCKKLCDTTRVGGCPGGQSCGTIQGIDRWGICRPGPATCSPANLGQDCPEGHSCYAENQTCRTFVCGRHGTLALGAPCTYSDDCGKGMICGNGQCMALCAGDGDCAGDAQCVSLEGCDPSFKACAGGGGGKPCTLGPDNAGCAANEMCYPADQQCTTLCFPHGSVPDGGPCQNINDCGKGLLCGSGKCRPACYPNKACPSITERCLFIDFCNNLIGSCSNEI